MLGIIPGVSHTLSYLNLITTCTVDTIIFTIQMLPLWLLGVNAHGHKTNNIAK